MASQALLGQSYRYSIIERESVRYQYKSLTRPKPPCRLASRSCIGTSSPSTCFSSSSSRSCLPTPNPTHKIVKRWFKLYIFPYEISARPYLQAPPHSGWPVILKLTMRGLRCTFCALPSFHQSAQNKLCKFTAVFKPCVNSERERRGRRRAVQGRARLQAPRVDPTREPPQSQVINSMFKHSRCCVAQMQDYCAQEWLQFLDFPHENARGKYLKPFAFTSGHLCSNFREVGHVTLRN